MEYSKYYDSIRFRAEKMYDRAAITNANSNYSPPPDIQLYYILEIISDAAALGLYEIRFSSTINETIYNKLCELGYTVIEDTDLNTTLINWRI